jgi:tRNA 2-selenouridine synthase
MRLPCLPAAALEEYPDLPWVDLRSPAEFARDHVPGALNLPLFSDEQRAIVGTLYHKESPDAAYEHGLAVVEKRLPQLLAHLHGAPVAEEEWLPRFRGLAQDLAVGQEAVQLEALTTPPKNKTIGLYCWRGGMRSRSMAALLHQLGLPVVLLEGGYKSYRQRVLARLEGLPARLEAHRPLLLLRGPTGVGKTAILAQLEAQVPGSTLCLESLARHRSSILGAVGKQPVSQALFEGRLLSRLEELAPGPVFVEGESRKVGDVILPEALYQAMEEGVQLRLGADEATRVRNLMDDYMATPGAAEEIAARLPFLEKRLGPTWTGRLGEWLAEGRAAEVTAVLLERYYDPLYAHSDRRRSWADTLQVEDADLLPRLLAWRTRADAGKVD